MAVVCGTVHAVAYRAYAIRPYNFRKTKVGYLFRNIPKTTWDVGKTMSYVEKIISDIIKTTSDIIFAICNALNNKTLRRNGKTAQNIEIQCVGKRMRISAKNVALLKLIGIFAMSWVRCGQAATGNKTSPP